MKDISDLRKEYALHTLDIESCETHPIAQFEKWFEQAQKADIPEPNALTLSTVRNDGRPSGRIVLLKGIEESKFVFYSNYQSKKGFELDANPACALTFFWPELERQVRVEGVASRISAERSDEYFHSRPRGSQLSAWASPQSTYLSDRSILDERMKQIELKFKDAKEIPRPNQWGGYEIEPVIVEFWQGRENRLHDRIQYRLEDDRWKPERLSP